MYIDEKKELKSSNTPIVSVIMPIYNAEGFLERGLSSIISQPCFAETEVLLIDDGSEDSSPKLCDEYASKYNNIFVIHKLNAGVAEARNDGLDKARGKYIAFLDADDWFCKNFFTRELMNELAEGKFSAYGFSYRVISFNFKYYTIERKVKNEVLFQNNYGSGVNFEWHPFWAFIYKTETIKKNGLRFFAVKYNEDLSFTQRFFYISDSVKYSDKLLYTQWSRLSSVMHSQNMQLFFDEHYKSLIMLKKWYNQRGVEYDPNPPILAIIGQVLPKICSSGYKKAYKIISNDSRFDLMNRVNDYVLSDAYKKEIKLYLQNPQKYCRKQRVFLKPKMKAIEILNKHLWTRSFIMFVYYRFVNKKPAVSRNEIKNIKTNSL